MKTRLLIIIGMILPVGFTFIIIPAYADCNINTDWPDAPCMDEIGNNHFPQHQVDQWTEYYEYKGKQFMESKKIEMNNAINSDQLLKWTDASIQNQNVWQYYYFSGQVPNPHEYLQGVEFKPIPYVNYVDFRTAEGEIIEVGCSSGLRASGNYNFGEDFLQFLKCNVSATLVPVFVIIGIIVGIVFIIKRKRK
jgi:hypothetical protein